MLDFFSRKIKTVKIRKYFFLKGLMKIFFSLIFLFYGIYLIFSYELIKENNNKLILERDFRTLYIFIVIEKSYENNLQNREKKEIYNLNIENVNINKVSVNQPPALNYSYQYYGTIKNIKKGIYFLEKNFSNKVFFSEKFSNFSSMKGGIFISCAFVNILFGIYYFKLI